MNRLFIVVAVCCALDVVLSCGNSDNSKADILQDSTEVNMVYTKWKISDANLVLAKQNIFQKDAKPECDTFDIVSLQGDTLLLGQPGQEKPIKYVYKEYPDSSKVAANSEKQ